MTATSADNTTTEGDTTGATDGNTTNGENGNGSGNQTDPAATAPVDAGDNQVTVIGDGNTSETADDETGTDGSGGDTTDGQDGTGSGNQTAPGIEAPVDTTDNQVTIIGDGNSTERDTESNSGDDGTDEPGEGPAGDTGSDGSTLGRGQRDGRVSHVLLDAPAGWSRGQRGRRLCRRPVWPRGCSLWGVAGLAMLMLGLVLIASQRRRSPVVVAGREVHPIG